MNKICRVCLEEGVLSSIFIKNYNISLCDMIEYCSATKISKNDGLPEQICSNCVYKLGIAYHFKQTLESADVRLRQYLGLHIPNKFSDVSVMTDPVIPHSTTIIKKCNCKSQEHKKNRSNYKKKPETEKLRRGPKPKPKKINSCYQCDKQFKCQAQLEVHKRTHTGHKPYGCVYCPRQFTQKHNLTIHLRVHTGEKPFQCEICSKRFSAQGNLTAHIKIHTGQKDHECSICNKSFISTSELTRHMNSHRGVKNFKCDMCESIYVHKRDLKLHKMKKHPPQPVQNVDNGGSYNKSNHIDIIGVDETNNITLPIRRTNFLDITNDKLPIANMSDTLYQPKVEKEVFKQNETRATFDPHICTICGEEFIYLAALAQHCLYRHKNHE